jgi:hypothetical protein
VKKSIRILNSYLKILNIIILTEKLKKWYYFFRDICERRFKMLGFVVKIEIALKSGEKNFF